MKTCPWNLEGLFSEAPFRWAAMKIPAAAPMLAKLDDMVGNGERNTVKKWWWDLEIQQDEGYRPTTNGSHVRDLQKNLKIDYVDQTLAVFPADQAPHPYPFPFPVDREKGIQAYEKMVSADEHRARVAAGDTDGLFHEYTTKSDVKVLHLDVSKINETARAVIQYELSMPDGSDLPAWTAGAHIDVVVAPGFIRQYSLSGNPADRKKYQIGVLREEDGKGGSKLMHRIFTLGRKIFISHPINHFPLDHTATKTFLMGGGIGITPMIAMAHELHTMGGDFALHYCVSSRQNAGFLEILAAVPWVDKTHLHFTDENTRADLPFILGDYRADHHVYTCGPDRFMDGVIAAATDAGFPDDARHLEYFTAPEAPQYENHAFTLKLTKSGREFHIPADRTTTDILLENGVHVDMKCADGICGVCKCGLISGDVEHRDFVLSNKQRENNIILCQSRAANADGVIEIDL
tara:strand:- start:18187 stop:19569 length:1383 start_codon:yes stop_codon:yes gene_type:complete